MTLFDLVSPTVKLNVEPALEIEEGKDFALTCEFESNTDLVELRWIKDNTSLSVSQNNHLLLTNVSKDDEGIYVCEVENQVGISSDHTEITILCKYPITPTCLVIRCFYLLKRTRIESSTVRFNTIDYRKCLAISDDERFYGSFYRIKFIRTAKSCIVSRILKPN